MSNTKETHIALNVVTNLIENVKVCKIEGSHSIATQALQVFNEIISKTQWKNGHELMKTIREQGQIFKLMLPQEFVIINVTRRVLKIIRDEFDIDEVPLSLYKLIRQTNQNEQTCNYSEPQSGLRATLMNCLQELETELRTSAENLSVQAIEHIHSSEFILTLGYSQSVERFLKKAAQQREFEVVVAECAPACRGHILSMTLAKSNIKTTIIPDATIFGIMSRVNKVIIGTHCVFANGGLRAVSGTLAVVLAAKYYSVPVIVLCPTYKISPTHLCNYEQNRTNTVKEVEQWKSISFSNEFDYVPPELITLFISNQGSNAPSYLYYLLNKMYHSNDIL